MKRGAASVQDARDQSWETVLRRDRCAYCGGPSGTIDHIHPSSRGGNDDWQNLTSACGNCNNRKGSTLLLEFLTENPIPNEARPPETLARRTERRSRRLRHETPPIPPMMTPLGEIVGNSTFR